MSDAMSDAVITAFDAHDAMSDIDTRQPECLAVSLFGIDPPEPMPQAQENARAA